MNLNDTLTLLRAGYTKAEIEAMEQPAPAEPEQTPAEPEQTPAEPEQTQQTQAEPEQTPAANDGYAKLEALLNKFINTAQANNLNANMAGGMQQKSTTDILAGVIAPPAKKERTK